MSKAYREWKANIKKYRRGELPHCEHGYIILISDTSMAAYRKIRRIRQRELKRNKKIQKIMDHLEKLRLPDIEWKLYGNPYQVSEGERIRQANEHGRQA